MLIKYDNKPYLEYALLNSTKQIIYSFQIAFKFCVEKSDVLTVTWIFNEDTSDFMWC